MLKVFTIIILRGIDMDRFLAYSQINSSIHQVFSSLKICDFFSFHIAKKKLRTKTILFVYQIDLK